MIKVNYKENEIMGKGICIMKKLHKCVLPTEAGTPYANSRYFSYGDYRLHYRVDEAKGTEKAKMLLIHGFMCNTGFFDDVVPYFTENGIKCVRIDLPDFGYSTREQPGIQYVPRSELLSLFMDELDEDNSGWLLLGHSMGGGVALDLALAVPSKIKAVLLNCPFFLPNVPDVLGNMVMTKPMRGMMNVALDYLFAYPVVEAAVIAVMTASVDYTKSYTRGVMSNPFAIEHSGDGLCYMTAKSKGMQMAPLANLSMPIQLITGKMDVFVMPTNIIKLKKFLPSSLEAVSYPTGGHCLIQDKAERVASDNLSFLKKKNLI